MQSIQFSVDRELCIGCGACTDDCPLRVLALREETPAVVAERENQCIGCLHCLTICPTGAISILGHDPEDCLEIGDIYPDPDQMEALIRGRRSCRNYVAEEVDRELIERLLQVGWQAPTGVNNRGVLFTVVDNLKTMDTLRRRVYEDLAAKITDNSLPDHLAFYGGFVELWQNKGVDVLFRGAPHLLIASAPSTAPCPAEDCIIALAYVELFAHSLGLGTVWDGLAGRLFTDLLPELSADLGLPAEHRFGYAMAFGRPAVSYQRIVPLRPAAVNRVELS